MDDDSPYNIRSSQHSSSDSEPSTSKATRLKKKKKTKQAENKKIGYVGESNKIDYSSDSDETFDVATRGQRKKTVKRNETSSLSSESNNIFNRSGNTLNQSSSSFESSVRPSCSRVREEGSPNYRHNQTPASSSTDSPITFPRRKIHVIGSDSSPSSTDITVPCSSRRTRTIISESPSNNSDTHSNGQRGNSHLSDQPMSTDDEDPVGGYVCARKDNKLSSTESSDEDNSPCCAICLSSLVNRIAAQISGCTHEFHNTCILKWAERTNTCPIDRSTFNKITVKNKEGKVVKITEIENNSAATADDDDQPFPIEVINCVICGSPHNEDVLLLCDGCNRGYHIYCLYPPLEAVPEGNWICDNCSPDITLSDSVYFDAQLDISIQNDWDNSNMSEGSSNDVSDDSEQPSTSSRQTRPRTSRYRNGSTLTVSVSRQNQTVSRNTRVRQTTITIKQTRKRRKRRRRRQLRNQQSTVSNRSRLMAAAIAKKTSSGGCAEGTGPESRQRDRPLRQEVGRPRLSLFSSDNFDTYYNPNSDSGGETEGLGSGPVAVTARTRYPTARIMDRKSAVARLNNTSRRPRVAPRIAVPTPSSSANVLDDILGMMTNETKKTTEKLPIQKDGTFVLPEKIDVNSDKHKEKVTETPGYPGGNRPRSHYGGPSGGYQGSTARHQSGVFSSRGLNSQFPSRFSNFPGGRQNSDNFFFRSPQPRFRSNHTFHNRRSLPASLLIEPDNEQEDPAQADEDVDIYGDIDSTSLVPPESSVTPTLEPPPQPPPGLLDLGPPPEPPAGLLNIGSPEEGPSDEDKGLIIDDNEYDPAEPCDSPEPGETALSLSSDSPSEDLGAIPIPDSSPVIHTCAPPPPGHVIAVDSDEECPNSSMYSSTSLAFARKKSKLNEESVEDNSVPKSQSNDKKDASNSIAFKSTPIRFSIGNKNPILSEPAKKIDLFNLADEETNSEESNSEDDKLPDEPDKDESKANNSEDESSEGKKKEEPCVQNGEVNSTEMGLDEDDFNEESLLKDVVDLENNLKQVVENDDENEILKSPTQDDEDEKEKVESNDNFSKDNSLELSPQKLEKEIEKSLEDDIFGSEKGEDNEVDKDEVSTQGDILDLNTENLHGDVTAHDGSLPETDKFEDDSKTKSDSFNCLDGLDVDPVSDSEYGSLSDNAEVDEEKSKLEKRKKKKRKNTDREEGEIVEPKKKDRKKEKDENVENCIGEKKTKKKKDKEALELSPLQEKTISNNKDNFDNDPTESVSWKKLSKNTKDRNYRDKDESKNKKRKEARKEIERYNVRKVVGDKAFQRKDEFGRDISLSRSRSPSFGKSPPPARKRSISREKSRSPMRKTKKRRSRSRSIERFRNTKRSLSRSPIRQKRRSRSPSIVRPKDRKFPKNRGRSRSRSRRRSRTPKKLRSRSRSKQKRRSRSRDKAKGKNKKDKNHEVISFKTNNVKKKKKKQPQRSGSWTKTKRKSRSPRGRSPWDFSSTSISRSPSPAPFVQKSRSWSREKNLTVIVPNTKKKDKKKSKENRRRKHKDDHSPTLSKEVFTSGDNILVSVNFAHAEKNTTENVTMEKVKGPNKRSKKDIQAIKAAKVRELAAKTKPVAIIDLDVSPFRERTPSPKEVIVLCDSDSDNNAKASDLKASSGPKTPPEPHIKFSINSKNQTINTIANPLLDIDDNKGPNTPPDPPSPLPTSPYDPFDPTKSRSPSPVSQSAPNEGDKTSDGHDKNQLDLHKPGTPNKDSTASPSKVSSVNDDNSVSNQNTNSKQDDKLVTSSMSITLPSLPIYTPAMTTTRNNMNGAESLDDILNIDSDGVYSPASSLGDDLFDPPKKSPPPANKKFDSLFVPKNAPAKPTPYEPKTNKSHAPSTAASKKAKYTPTKSKSKPISNISKLDEDQLKILDEVPSSAVEMQVKYKYLKKLNRQERVVEEVKIVLKPHYNKKHVTKEQYKDILRKSVPKICHNKSGEINPSKIHQLVEAYVKKYRIHNKRTKNPNGANTNSTNNSNANHNNTNNANNIGAGKKGKNMWC